MTPNKTPEYARMMLTQLRRYSKEKTANNNVVVGIPVLDLFAWAAFAGEAPSNCVDPQELQAASDLLHGLKLCVAGTRQTQIGQVPTLDLTERGRDATDDEINRILFPYAS